jgi:hypothetical protein
MHELNTVIKKQSEQQTSNSNKKGENSKGGSKTAIEKAMCATESMCQNIYLTQ